MSITRLITPLSGLCLFAFSWAGLPPLAQAESKPNSVTFFCEKLPDVASESDVQVPANPTEIPFTVVWVPERNGYIRLIAWKSEFFTANGKDPLTRCQEVTQKFQTSYANNQLDYLASSYIQGYPVICGLSAAEKEASENIVDVCTPENQLLTLKPHDRPDQMLKAFFNALEGKSNEAIYHSSKKNKLFFWVREILRRRDTSPSQGPKQTATGGSQLRPDAPVPNQDSANSL